MAILGRPAFPLSVGLRRANRRVFSDLRALRMAGRREAWRSSRHYGSTPYFAYRLLRDADGYPDFAMLPGRPCVARVSLTDFPLDANVRSRQSLYGRRGVRPRTSGASSLRRARRLTLRERVDIAATSGLAPRKQRTSRACSKRLATPPWLRMASQRATSFLGDERAPVTFGPPCCTGRGWSR